MTLCSRSILHTGASTLYLEKTGKQLAEMQIELNMTYNFSGVLEDGVKLVDCFALSRMGLMNLGNSCYVNSVMQVLMFCPGHLLESALQQSHAALTGSCCSAADDLKLQLCKLATGLDTSRYISCAKQVREKVLEKGHLRGA